MSQYNRILKAVQNRPDVQMHYGIGHNSYARFNSFDKSIDIIYHWTVIVKMLSDRKTVILDSGGYQSSTTKTHINSVLDSNHVVQTRWLWRVYHLHDRENHTPFTDKMTIQD